MQGRGLKQEITRTAWIASYVAPHAGAWIETKEVKGEFCLTASPLMQGRGLKPNSQSIQNYERASPLMQGRGLKLIDCAEPPGRAKSPLMQGRGLKQITVVCIFPASIVAPHAGAWIETWIRDACIGIFLCRPSCRGVD